MFDRKSMESTTSSTKKKPSKRKERVDEIEDFDEPSANKQRSAKKKRKHHSATSSVKELPMKKKVRLESPKKDEVVPVVHKHVKLREEDPPIVVQEEKLDIISVQQSVHLVQQPLQHTAEKQLQPVQLPQRKFPSYELDFEVHETQSPMSFDHEGSPEIKFEENEENLESLEVMSAPVAFRMIPKPAHLVSSVVTPKQDEIKPEIKTEGDVEAKHLQLQPIINQSQIKNEKEMDKCMIQKVNEAFCEEKSEVKPKLQPNLSATATLIPPTHWVKLKIGGKIYDTTVETLTSEPDSIFTCLFSMSSLGNLTAKCTPSALSQKLLESAIQDAENLKLKERFNFLKVEVHHNVEHSVGLFTLVHSDAEITVIIDRDGLHFEPVINFMRTKRLILPPSVSRSGVLEEARFYNITALVDLLENGDQNLSRSDILELVSESPAILRLRGSNMENIDLQRINLQNVDLSFCNLKNGDFSDATLIGAKFKKTLIDQAKFVSCEAAKCKMEDVEAKCVDMAKADISGTVLIRVKLLDSTLDDAIMDNSSLSYCQIEESSCKSMSCSSASMESTKFLKVTFTGTKFDESRFTNVLFHSCLFERTSFRNCRFSSMVLEEMDLSGCNFSECQFEEVTFKGTELSRIIFAKVTFLHCTFLNVKMDKIIVQQKSRFLHCKFSGSSMRFANIQPESEIKYALFQDVDLRDCIFTKMSFEDNRLKSSKLDATVFRSCSIDMFHCQECSLNGCKILDCQSNLRDFNFVNCSGYVERNFSSIRS